MTGYRSYRRQPIEVLIRVYTLPENKQQWHTDAYKKKKKGENNAHFP